jgi:hypothetical protein
LEGSGRGLMKLQSWRTCHSIRYASSDSRNTFPKKLPLRQPARLSELTACALPLNISTITEIVA